MGRGRAETDGDRAGGQRGSGAGLFGVPRPVWWAVSGLVLAAVVVFAITRRTEFAAALKLIGKVDPGPLLVIAACEAASLAFLAALQQWVLRAGGKDMRLRLVAAIMLASNAAAGALPGGAVFAVGWAFRQLRRRGVEQAVAGMVLVVSGMMSALGLLTLLTASVLVTGSGPFTWLRPVLTGLLLAALVTLAAALALSRLGWARRRARRAWQRVGLRSRRMWSLRQDLTRLARRVHALRPGLAPWVWPFTLALLNWGLDFACLLACAWGLGAGVPWPGILVVYTVTQVAGSLRLTPGSLGVIEASMTTLLVLYGLRPDQAIALALLYRAASYWALQPVGWTAWLVLTLHRGGTGKPPQEG